MIDCVVPLFPLSINVLPGEYLSLRILEPQYLKLVAYCLGQNEQGIKHNLGFLLSSRRGSAEIGALARVESILKRHSDGTIDILTFAHSRFEIVFRLPEQEFPRAHVRILEDDDVEVEEEVQEAIEGSLEAIFSAKPQSTELLAPYNLSSFTITRLFKFDLYERQHLLSLPGENERLKALAEFLAFRVELLRRGASGDLSELYSE